MSFEAIFPVLQRIFSVFPNDVLGNFEDCFSSFQDLLGSLSRVPFQRPLFKVPLFSPTYGLCFYVITTNQLKTEYIKPKG